MLELLALDSTTSHRHPHMTFEPFAVRAQILGGFFIQRIGGIRFEEEELHHQLTDTQRNSRSKEGTHLNAHMPLSGSIVRVKLRMLSGFGKFINIVFIRDGSCKSIVLS